MSWTLSYLQGQPFSGHQFPLVCSWQSSLFSLLNIAHLFYVWLIVLLWKWLQQVSLKHDYVAMLIECWNISVWQSVVTWHLGVKLFVFMSVSLYTNALCFFLCRALHWINFLSLYILFLVSFSMHKLLYAASELTIRLLTVRLQTSHPQFYADCLRKYSGHNVNKRFSAVWEGMSIRKEARDCRSLEWGRGGRECAGQAALQPTCSLFILHQYQIAWHCIALHARRQWSFVYCGW
jgi:hypothetical protein